MAETVLVQNSLEEKMGMVALLDAEGLTKELVDELIERIDVYGDDRVEIKWKFSIQDSPLSAAGSPPSCHPAHLR